MRVPPIDSPAAKDANGVITTIVIAASQNHAKRARRDTIDRV